MDNTWQTFFEQFPKTVTGDQLPVKLPRFDLDFNDLDGAAADWCHQYLKDRKCPSDLIVFLTKIIKNNLKIQWAAEPQLFGFRPDKNDYQALWVMQRVIAKLNEVCLTCTNIPYQPILPSVWWSSFVLKNIRRQMEDYITIVPYLHTLFDIKDYGEASFYAVYDGHNGLDAAVYSSMYLHQHLVQSSHYPTNPEYALYDAFFTTDQGFTKKTENYNLVSGTTAVCVLLNLKDRKLYVGWVGDSIAMLWKNGTPLCLVNKHVPDRHDEAERIKNEGGIITQFQGIWRVDGQLAVSRAIGDVKYKPHITCQPEIRTLVLDENDEFLVLGSDGLWEYTTPEEIADTIYDELFETDGDVSGVSNKLVFKSKKQGSKDNISVITVFLQDPKQLVAKRRAAIMETAMEQRNASSTLASFGQDAGDFGPETDVDTPDEPIGLTKPKVEGEANVIYESGEDSEEDNSGWNYYKKSATEEKKTSNNSDAEDDMDYKLNPDAPEFVPVSSPPAMNHAQRFVNMETDDLILSSPQKYKDTIDHMDVPDEKEFTNEIKMHAADLSKFGNLIEPTKSTDDSTMLNNTKPENEEVTTEHNENFLIKNEHIANENMEKYTNPFVSDTDDLNKVQDLSEYIKDDAHENITGINVSMIETSKINELDSASGNELENESNIKLNNHLLMNEHITYEQGMNLKNNDDATNVIIDDSILPQNNELFKRNDDFKNEFLDNSNNDKYSHYDDHKLNDSVSTTDAVIGSEPNTPMRMDNQSTFESENDDDQLSESFKQQLKFNQFDENNDKENHDPFCFEQTEDSAGIIPNAINKENETVDETFNDDNTIPNISSNIDHVSESIKHEPVEEPLCIKEKAKPIHLVSEEQLPESDIPANTHEPLLNTSENNINTKYFEEQEIVESEDKNEQEISDKLLAQEVYNPESVITNHTENIEQDDSEEDDIKDHIASQQEFYQDNMYNLEQENLVNNQNEDLKSEYDNVNDYKIENHTSYIQDHDEHFAKSEYDNVNDNDNKIENHTSYIQDHDEHFAHHNPNEESINYHEDLKHNIVSDVVKDCIEEFHENVTEVICNNTEHFKNENKSNVEDIQNYVENVKQHDITEMETQDQVEHLNEKENNILEIKNNYGEDFKHEHQDNIENIDVENNVINSIKEEHNSVTELVQNHNGDFQLENYGVESIENRTVDSDEEMHSSMIIHSDVENNMPQPYCSSHDTLLNEPNMMSTSMTFEENFHNRNMNDSLYVMETSSDYFGEELEQATQINKSINETKADEQLSNIDSEIIEPNKIENKIISEPKSTVEEIEAESTELNQLSSQDYHIENNENIDKQEDNNKVSEIAIATVVGAAAIAAVTGASLTSKKSTPKKVETTVSKVKTTTTKTTPTKPLSSKTSTPPIKKTTASTTTSKPISRPLTAPSTTSKPTANVRPTTAPKTSVLKTSTVTAKVLPKTVPKTAISSSRPNSAKTTSTTPRTSLTKTTTSKSPTPKSTVITKPSTPPKTNTPRTSTLISKQTLTNGSPKSLSRPSTAPAKKPLSNGIANGTSNLTNGDGVKTSTTTKSPITLATRMSLAPPKMPPKVKAAPKTVVAPPMPGPIRRPKAPITKKD